ncbi:MAG: NERD domain-containing protein [Anaerolineae bacterium]
MKIVTNQSFLDKKAKLGRRTSLAGMVILIAGLIISLTSPEWILVSMACLIVGFALANVIGMYNLNRWVKEPRSDQILVKVLKGLDNKHFLYNYVLPSPHVLMNPAGLFVLLPKRQEGKIICRKDRWRQKLRLGSLLRIFVDEPLGNPTEELRAEVGALKRFLEKNSVTDVPVSGLVVFTSEKAELEIEEPTFPAVKINELKVTLREISQERDEGQILHAGRRKELAELFERSAQA